MHNDLLLNIALVLGLGMFAQWFAWKVRQPSIIFLLLFGLIVGPISIIIGGEHAILDVEHFLGELLFPVVSASVGVILFEGGLSLRFRDLEGTGGVVGKLVSVGVVVTWIISAVAAHFLFGAGWEISMLLGATLVVTGPTVIIPLLKQIRPKGRVGSILRWEGIVIDPVGAILAVLVFDFIIGSNAGEIALAIFLTLLVGLGIGWLAAQIMVELYRRYLVPDSLQNPITLGFVLAAFAISNMIQPESGLLTVTVMGIVMANQRRFDIHHIVEFKETLQVLLLSSLFILLSARMTPDDLLSIGVPTLIFVLIIIVVERPLAVLFSTWGSDLTWQERTFVSWMAPRGIVAASVASIFAIELTEAGYEEASILLPITFAVIIGTVVTYSFTSGLVARRLGLAEKNPQGVLMVGAAPWIREVAREIKTAGYRVIVSDTNAENISRAKQDGIEVYFGNILSEMAQDEINFGGIGRLVALTSNHEVNALAGEHFQTTFGSENVFALQQRESEERDRLSMHLGGRTVFPPDTTPEIIRRRYMSGARVMTVTVKSVQAVQNAIPDAILPLFTMPDDDRLLVWTEEDAPALRQGVRIIGLVESENYDDLVEQGAIVGKIEELPVTSVPQV